MHLDLYVAIAGLIVGFVVGLTGMGGGALMTPILVLLFKVEPLTAVSSDLVAALVMKPVGGAVHARRGTVNYGLVKWLMVGSVPCAFAGVFVLKSLGDNATLQGTLKIVLGVALLAACTSMIVKAAMQRKREAQGLTDGAAEGRLTNLHVKVVPTIIIGALGGLIVGMTSVGSGSIIIVSLLFLYPRLTSPSLVGTDLVQAVPLVASAALGHILFGDFSLGLTTSILIGSIPGVYFGARMSSRSPDAVVRKALIFVLLASGLKLVNVPTVWLGWIMGGLAVGWFLIPWVLHRFGVRPRLPDWLPDWVRGRPPARREAMVPVPARRAEALTAEPVEVDL